MPLYKIFYMTLEEYKLNPNYCKYCLKIIEPVIYKNKYNFYYTKKKLYCDRDCYAKGVTGKLGPSKRCSCGNRKHNRAKQCIKCFSLKNDIGYRSLKEHKIITKTYSNYRIQIAKNARTVFKKLNNTCCKNCGYKHHIDACHIKAVADFDENSLIKEVNDPNNLIALCPNCHWEFDNNLLDIKNIAG